MTERDVKACIEAVDEAYARNDAEAYFAHFDEKATIIVPGVGQWPLAGYIEKWTGMIASGGGVARSSLSGLHIQLSPSSDAAITNYVLDVIYRGMNPAAPGETQDSTLFITEVWFCREGRWRIAHMSWSAREQQ